MKPDFIIAGHLAREYLLPPFGRPRLDAPGGSLLYAAGGLAVWGGQTGILGRVGEDYPQQWLHDLETRGIDIAGIRIQPKSLDLRAFIAYSSNHERSQSSPVSHFARREMTFPKTLLGYQAPAGATQDPRQPDPLVPAPVDIPKEYRGANAIHVCPMNFISQSQLVNVLRGNSTRTLTLDPSPGTMTPGFWRDLRLVLQGVTAFLPAEQEIQNLFWGETNDLWQMAEAICEVGVSVVVIKRGALGQYIYDANGHRRWELPAYPATRFADPTGAGDAFCGGFLAGFQKNHDPLLAALYGNVSASLKVEGSGPFYPLEVIPGLAEARLQSMKELVREV